MSADRVYVSRFNYFGGYAIRALPNIVIYNHLASINATHASSNSGHEKTKSYLSKHAFEGVDPVRMSQYVTSKNGANSESEMEANLHKIFATISDVEYNIWHEEDWNLDAYVSDFGDSFKQTYDPLPRNLAGSGSKERRSDSKRRLGKKDNKSNKNNKNRQKRNTNYNHFYQNSRRGRTLLEVTQNDTQPIQNAQQLNEMDALEFDQVTRLEGMESIDGSQRQLMRSSSDVAARHGSQERGMKLNIEPLYPSNPSNNKNSEGSDTSAQSHYMRELRDVPDRRNVGNVGNVGNVEQLVEQNYDANDISSVLSVLPVSCVHIGNSAAISGVTLYMTPKYNPYFYFSKREQLAKEDYANVMDPCNISAISKEKFESAKDKGKKLNERNDEKKGRTKKKRYDYDDMSKDKGDDDGSLSLGTHGSHGNGKNRKNGQDRQERRERIGFDYLISEHEHVPGYQLLPYGGVVYGLAQRSFWKLFQAPLEPKLYILKKI